MWYEIDELIERFDEGRIKLLPTPKNKFKKKRSVFNARTPHHWSGKETDEDDDLDQEPNRTSSPRLHPEDY